MRKLTLGHKVALIAIALLTTWVLSWLTRGVYDKVFMMEGRILAINCTDQPIDITVDFPSGKQHQFSLQPKGAHDFTETNTGEGNLTVTVTGRPPDLGSYVTSHNGILVLSIDDTNTTFSKDAPLIAYSPSDHLKND